MILCTAEWAKAIDKAVFPGTQGGPLMHVIAGKAVALKEALEPAFVDYQRQVVANAKRLAEGLSKEGLRIVSGGTDNHLFSVDVRSVSLTGKAASAVMDEVGITVNKNTIPNDPESPFVTSGVRIGTPALTTRGMKEPEMDRIAEAIASLLRDPENPVVRTQVERTVASLCAAFPLYEGVPAGRVK
ncbi:Serine hydroxymethyltransferase [compost metagenome]